MKGLRLEVETEVPGFTLFNRIVRSVTNSLSPFPQRVARTFTDFRLRPRIIDSWLLLNRRKIREAKRAAQEMEKELEDGL